MRIDLVGQKFGMLTVMRFAGRVPGSSLWEVRCDCGNIKVMRRQHLLTISKSGGKSCGCSKGHLISLAKITHGLRRTDEYRIWGLIIHRCTNPNAPSWHRYGGRGISVCEEWKNSFECFFKDVGARPSKNHSLDRIDNDGNYTPGNCRWATALEQANNTATVKFITFDGIRHTLSQWERITGISKDTIANRLRSGWPINRALTVKVRHQQKSKEKLRARSAVNYAVAHGKLRSVKTLQCTKCERQATAYHHHNGYDRKHRLDVIPLCTRCHEFCDHQ